MQIINPTDLIHLAGSRPFERGTGAMSERQMNRRVFLEGAVAGGALLGVGSSLALGADVTGRPKAGPIGDFKISLAEWSLHRALFARKIDNLDFPRIAREDYGIEGAEFVNQFFKDKAQDSTYFKDLKKRAGDVGVTCVLIMIDGEGDLSAEDKEDDGTRRSTTTRSGSTRRRRLGCHAIRVNTGHHYSPNQPRPGLRSVRAAHRVWHQERDLDHLRESWRAFEQPRRDDCPDESRQQAVFGTLPDFGNFLQDGKGNYKIDIYDAIARMMPYAKGVSAKSYDFGAEWQGDKARLRADPQDRHRRRLPRLRRDRIRGRPSERARGHQGHQAIAREAPGLDVRTGHRTSQTLRAVRPSIKHVCDERLSFNRGDDGLKRL